MLLKDLTRGVSSYQNTLPKIAFLVLHKYHQKLLIDASLLENAREKVLLLANRNISCFSTSMLRCKACAWHSFWQICELCQKTNDTSNRHPLASNHPNPYKHSDTWSRVREMLLGWTIDYFVSSKHVQTTKIFLCLKNEILRWRKLEIFITRKEDWQWKFKNIWNVLNETFRIILPMSRNNEFWLGS